MSCNPNFQSCTPATCLHSTTCHSPFLNEIKCNCTEASLTFRLGPRCQWLKRTFTPSDNFKYFQMDTSPTLCTNTWHLSMEYLVRDNSMYAAHSATLLYIGPSTVGSNLTEPLLSVQWNQNTTQLITGSLDSPLSISNIEKEWTGWRRLDLFLNALSENQTMAQVTLMKDLCTAFRLKHIPDPQSCLLQTTIPTAAIMDPQSRIYIAGRPDIGTTTLIPASFKGCVKNVRINSELQSLYQADTPDSQNDCGTETNSCYAGDCGEGNCRLTLMELESQCVCNPGFSQENAKSGCWKATPSFKLSASSGARWSLSRKSWDNLREPHGRFYLPVQFRYRTTSEDATLMTIMGQTNEKSPKDLIITIGIKERVLTTSYRTKNDPQVFHLSLPNTVNAADGRWHSVQYIRRGPTLSLQLDHGEGQNFAFFFEPQRNLTVLDEIDCITHVSIGNYSMEESYGHFPKPLPMGTAAATIPVEESSFTGVIDDIRLFQTRCSLEDTGVEVTDDLKPPDSGKYEDPCAGWKCAENEECVTVWPKAKCRPKFNCNTIKEALCLNGGTCSWNATSVAYACSCVKGFIGERCEDKLSLAGGGGIFEWWWILVAILLFLLLLLILGLIYCCCCKVARATSSHKQTEIMMTRTELEKPMEKVVEFTVQGAGEVDYKGAIDFSYFQANLEGDVYPDGNLIYPPPQEEMKVEPELDYPLEYAYEGRMGSPVPSFSTLPTSETNHWEPDEPLELPHMSDWGPQFHAINSIYSGQVPGGPDTGNNNNGTMRSTRSRGQRY